MDHPSRRMELAVFWRHYRSAVIWDVFFVLLTVITIWLSTLAVEDLRLLWPTMLVACLGLVAVSISLWKLYRAVVRTTAELSRGDSASETTN